MRVINFEFLFQFSFVSLCRIYQEQDLSGTGSKKLRKDITIQTQHLMSHRHIRLFS